MRTYIYVNILILNEWLEYVAIIKSLKSRLEENLKGMSRVFLTVVV